MSNAHGISWAEVRAIARDVHDEHEAAIARGRAQEAQQLKNLYALEEEMRRWEEERTRDLQRAGALHAKLAQARQLLETIYRNAMDSGGDIHEVHHFPEEAVERFLQETDGIREKRPDHPSPAIRPS